MRRLVTAPNLAIATLWADMLTQGGVAASVQRAYACALAGQIPVDQCLPEVWVDDESEHERAASLLAELRRPRHRSWWCRQCSEKVEGPFDQCWSCGADMPPQP